jgi:hypothetical protein
MKQTHSTCVEWERSYACVSFSSGSFLKQSTDKQYSTRQTITHNPMTTIDDTTNNENGHKALDLATPADLRAMHRA